MSYKVFDMKSFAVFALIYEFMVHNLEYYMMINDLQPRPTSECQLFLMTL